MVREANYQNEAYDAIKHLILTSELIPGQRISKNKLVEILGIGETPIREAIIRLRKEGLFHVIPQSGTYVSKINIQEVFQAKFVRENIERLVFEEVCDRISISEIQELEMKLKIQKIYFDVKDKEMYFKLDEEFHRYFYEVVQKLYVWDWIQLINLSFNRCRYLRLQVNELKWEAILDQHQQMIELIKVKDKCSLGNLVVKHIDMIDHDIHVIKKHFPDYFE